MSDFGSDSYPGLNFSDFTSDDFAEIDATVASKLAPNIGDIEDVAEASFQSEIDGLNLSLLTPQQLQELDGIPEDIDDGLQDLSQSVRSDGFDINLGALTADQLAELDGNIEDKIAGRSVDGPAVQVEIEGDSPGPDAAQRSPLEEFRSYMSLSVTDLVSPSWCEVQYDYGLRGKRSRPIHKRPTSFLSASGKTIQPEIATAQQNDVQTKQGLAVHKELEREVKFEELEIEITTDETRWGLRLFNMIACLRLVMAGLAREMPVFGILHDEVVIGVMDELVKTEVPKDSPLNKKNSKRPLDKSYSSPTRKRSRKSLSPSQSRIDTFFESPKKSNHKPESESSATSPPPREEQKTGYMLHIKDNKTRGNPCLPREPDMYSGTMQLMIYRKLLCELLATDPPFDFSRVWEKVGVDSTEIFPTKFLVQAKLVEDTLGFQTCCLDDMVGLWHRTVKEMNIVGVDHTLELVYRLRPPDDLKQKNRMKTPLTLIADEDSDLKKAIAASLKEQNLQRLEQPMENEAGPSNWEHKEDHTKETSVPEVIDLTTPDVDSVEIQLQWALQQSAAPEVPEEEQKPPIVLDSSAKDIINLDEHCEPAEEDGIRRFKIIGSKKFKYDEELLEKHLTRVFQWWRGERPPEGVPLDRAYRCRTCEYANDCEWRAQKALELSKKKHPT
ncbi:hypothetical protein CPC08DRAFT_680578 [Agrocybe pediades]|nr:hypothetical protein CPC08DRAFT_680578 [Agrocybe pediades]